MPLPVSQLWEDTLAYAQRESRLLVPLTLAMLGLGQAMMELAFASAENKQSALMVGGLGLFGILLAFTGQLAIQALVLKPGESVSEALTVAANRLPKLIMYTLLIALIFVIAALPLSVILVATGFNPETSTTLPPFAMLYLAGMFALLSWINVRLYTLPSVIVDRNPPLSEALKQSFAQTRGHGLIILGVLLVFLLVGVIIQAAAQGVVGFIFAAIGKMAGLAYLDTIMVALAVGMAAAGVGLLTSIFAALLYRNLSK